MDEAFFRQENTCLCLDFFGYNYIVSNSRQRTFESRDAIDNRSSTRLTQIARKSWFLF